MTKVGVITMHRVDNCGSVLQAYATQCMIEKLGCECEIIDYIYPNSYQFERGAYRQPAWRNMIAPKLWWMRSEWGKLRNLDRFIRSHLKLSASFDSPQAIKAAPPVYDIYLTGSDQVWNPRYTKGDTTFLLDFVKDKKKVAYSASFASNKLDGGFVESFKPLLQRYDAITVRDAGGKQIIKDLLGKDVPVVLDPTLLLDAEEWYRLLPKSYSGNPYGGKKYILVYIMNYAFNPYPVLNAVLRRLKEQTSYDIVCIGKMYESGISDYKEVRAVGPFKFLQLFKYASYVVTSSFHGTAFAVNFGKPLLSVVAPDASQDDRQISLLESLGMECCAVRDGKDAGAFDLGKIEKLAKEANKKLLEIREKSVGCLKGMLAK